LGVASIVFSTQVNSKWAMGDLGGAQAASDRAKKFAIWSAIAWVPFVILFVVLRIVAGGLATTTGSGY